jgi:hypothetical protein
MPKRIHLALALAVVVAVAGPALGAGNLRVTLQIKPGLWQYNDTTRVTGDTIIAEAMLAHVPPAQRAQFIADMRKQLTSPQRERECMTQPKFEQRISTTFGTCTRKMASNTIGKLDVQSVCHSEGSGMKEDTTQRIVVSNGDGATITTHAVTTRGGKSMTIDATETGRWISTACNLGDVIQQLP